MKSLPSVPENKERYCLRFWQCFPLNFGVQKQTCPPAVFVHEPPLRQGLCMKKDFPEPEMKEILLCFLANFPDLFNPGQVTSAQFGQTVLLKLKIS